MRLESCLPRALVLLLVAPLIAIGQCSQQHSSPQTPVLAQQDQLELGSDGTATATGTVIENYLGCRIDVACYLRLRVGKKEVRIIYHPGESEGHLNKNAYEQGAKANKGGRVTAYGQYRKRGTIEAIETFSSDAFYIRILSN